MTPDPVHHRKSRHRRVAAGAVATALIVFALTGCGRGLKFSPLNVPANLAPRTPAQVEVFMPPQGPRCQFTNTGIYRYSGYTVFNSEGGSIAAMREDAARRGFDGLYDLYCAAPGTVGGDISACSAKSFVCLR